MLKTLGLLLLAATLALACAHHPPGPEATDWKLLAHPAPEHAWLQRFVGDWDCACEYFDDAGKPKGKTRVTQTGEALGDFWVILNGTGTHPTTGKLLKGSMLFGFDPATKKYFGNSVDSASGYCWRFTGELDANQNKLALTTLDASPISESPADSQTVIEFQDADHYTITSSTRKPGGDWTKRMQANCIRKK